MPSWEIQPRSAPFESLREDEDDDAIGRPRQDAPQQAPEIGKRMGPCSATEKKAEVVGYLIYPMICRGSYLTISNHI
jgi:hypothetical protein